MEWKMTIEERELQVKELQAALLQAQTLWESVRLGTEEQREKERTQLQYNIVYHEIEQQQQTLKEDQVAGSEDIDTLKQDIEAERHDMERDGLRFQGESRTSFNIDAGCARGAGFSLAFRFSAVRGAGVSNQSQSFTLWNTLTCSDYEQTDYIFPFAADAHFYCSGQNTSNLSGIQYSEAQVDILQSLAEDGYVYDLRLKTDDTEVGISHIPVAFRMEGQYYLVNHIDFVIQYRERKNGSHEVFGFEGIGRSYGYERENFGVDGCELRGSGYPEE
ncbi:MAG: hypothetical protein EZS28_015863, partial [Streblomastix strix]